MMWVVLIVIICTVVMMTYCACIAPAPPTGPVLGGGPFRLKVSDPEYTALRNGVKTIEARLDRPPFNQIRAGDQIIVIRSRPQGDTSEYPGGEYKFDAEVVSVDKFKNLAELLKKKKLEDIYPDQKTASGATTRFEQYLPPGTSAADPVLAIEIRRAGAAKKKATAARGSTSYRDYGMYEDAKEKISNIFKKYSVPSKGDPETYDTHGDYDMHGKYDTYEKHDARGKKGTHGKYSRNEDYIDYDDDFAY